MGIDLYCGEMTYSCSYGGWNRIREHITQATFEFILDKFNKDKELYGNLNEDDDDWIGEGSEYYNYMENINEIIKNIHDKVKIKKNNDNDIISRFLSVIRKNIKLIDALIYFNINGLYDLCNKDDCEGFYSVGNSNDIYSLLELIKHNMIKFDSYNTIYGKDTREGCNSVFEVFKESVDKKLTVCIC
jgi:hypothetical protein